MVKEVLLLNFFDFKYSKDNIFVLNTSMFAENRTNKGFLEIKIFSYDGIPVDSANIRVSALCGINEYVINIDACGYYPVQINNVHFYPDRVCKLNVSMVPVKLKNQMFGANRKISPGAYKCIQNFQTEAGLPQNEIRELTIPLGMVTPKGSPSYTYAEKFAEEVSNLSGGKIKIDINTDGKLGTDRQMLRDILNTGNIGLIVQTTPTQVDFLPKLAVFDMPMVHTDKNYLREVMGNTEFYEKISDIYEDGGYKLLGFSDPLFRQLTTNREIQNIDDFEGIEIRTILNKNHEEFWRLLGATIVELPVSEIYTSLMHGFIDSADNPHENIIALKLYDMQKYLIRTNHLPHMVSLITSSKFYNSLSAKEKAIIDEAASKAEAYVRERADESHKEEEQFLIDNGMIILDLPDETKQAMKEKAMPVYETIRDLVNDDRLMELYLNEP